MSNIKNPQGGDLNPDTVIKKTAGNETARMSATVIDKQPHMVCHYMTGKEWQQKEFTAKKTKYRIGSSSQDSEVGIPEPEAERIQVVVRKVGGIWFVMEYARTDLLHINGIPNYQYLLLKDGYCYVRIGSSKLVLVKGDSQKKIPQGPPSDNKFILKQDDSSMAFSTLKPCMIGAHPSADFIVNSSMVENNLDPMLKEPFLAIINSYKNQLFIDSISEKFPVLLKGRTITDPTPICTGATFSIGELSFSIAESTTVNQTGDFIDFSGTQKKTFMLLEVLNDDNQTAVNIILPGSGKAVTIGRGTDATYQIVDQQISKQHVQLIIYDKSVLASDLGSTNGTFVNDEKIRKKLMHAGDFITVGDHTFFLCYKDKNLG